MPPMSAVVASLTQQLAVRTGEDAVAALPNVVAAHPHVFAVNHDGGEARWVVILLRMMPPRMASAPAGVLT